MKNIFSIVILFTTITLAGCATNQSKDNDKKIVPAIESKEIKTVEKNKSIEKFLGKPTVIILAGTFCPHCVKSMPEFETKIWDKYNKDVNIFVNVVDKGKFEQKRIKQGVDANLDFEKITGRECGYIPSWIILDKKGKVQNESCGGKKGIDEIEITLKELLK